MEDIQPRHVIDRLENRWPSRLQQDAKTWVSNGCGPPISSHSNRRCVGHPSDRQARPRSRLEAAAHPWRLNRVQREFFTARPLPALRYFGAVPPVLWSELHYRLCNSAVMLRGLSNGLSTHCQKRSKASIIGPRAVP